MTQPSRCQRREFLAACAAAATACTTTVHAGSSPTTPEIDADFPGGNVVLERIEGDEVHLHQDPRDTAGFWFYWYFRVRARGGRTLTFHFTKGNVIGVRGPAVSTDVASRTIQKSVTCRFMIKPPSRRGGG